MRKRIPLLSLLVFTLFFAGHSQEEPIYLTNPSFEDFPRHSKAPSSWYDCGFPGESEPDVQPSGEFSVTKAAFHGNTYLGMVVRDNDTWESVSQRLSRPMKKDQCYEFSLHLARSELYISLSRTSNETTNYVTPAKIRIYGGFGNCDKQYMLDETSLVISNRWLRYDFKFEPLENYTYITIEAFYETPTLFPYNGNILVDNASAIKPIPCEEEVANEPAEEGPIDEEDIARTEPPKPATKQEPPKPAPPKPEPPKPAPKEEKTISGVKRSEMSKGQSIVLNNLYFEADSSRIQSESFNTLNEVYEFLAENSDVVVEIGGHTNSLPPQDYCIRLSTQRAKAVVDFLANKGIARKRLQFKGYGKSKPIASNKTPYGRRQNQRVEIKILDMRDTSG